MAKKTYSAVNFGKKYKAEYIRDLTGTSTNVIIPSEIDGVTSTLKNNVFQDNLNLLTIDFNKCTTVPQNCCSGCTNLTTITLAPNTSTIAASAFRNTSKLVVAPGVFDNISSFGSYACYCMGQSVATDFTYKPNVPVTVGDYAFQQAKIKEIDGQFKSVGSSAFSSVKSCTKLHITINGSIGSYGFSDNRDVSDFYWNPDSILSAINSYAFANLGTNRTDPTQNPFIWDLRKSKFTTIPSQSWGGNKSSTFLFGSTLASITGYALAYSTDINIYLNSLPTLTATSAFTSASNLNIILNYELDADILKTMTNWSTYATYIHSGVTDFIGTLPTYAESSGVALDWYTDTTCTIPVSEAVDRQAFYYAVKGQAREVWTAQTTLVDSTVTISDGTTVYDKFIPVGTTVTITPAPTDINKPQLFLLQVDGIDYTTAGTATVVADHDIKIQVLYWNGVDHPFLPRLSDNSLEMIKFASKIGVIPDTWQPGDEITVKYDSVDYACRLVDTTGKFTRTADGSIAYLSFEFENLLPDKEPFMNVANNIVSNSTLLPKMNSGAIWNKLDPNLKDVLEEVDVQVMSRGNGSDQVLESHALKLFLPREGDLYSTCTHSVLAEFNAITQDEYYQLHDTNIARRKAQIQTPTQTTYYVEMSPRSNSYMMCAVPTYGDSYYIDGNVNTGVAIRFAL